MVKKNGELKSLNPEEMQRRRKEYERKSAAELKELMKNAKPLHELVVEEAFLINRLIYSSHATSYTPMSDMVGPGSRSSPNSTGHITMVTYDVTPVRKEVPVQALTFLGYSGVKPGDEVIAKIPRLKKGFKERFYNNEDSPDFYVDRPFETEEKAIELRIRPLEVEAYRSVLFDRYQKK